MPTAQAMARKFRERDERRVGGFKVGDHVIAGAGMRAELRSDSGPDAVVRWLQWDEAVGWWGYHHSRVPWSTIRPVEEVPA